MLKGIASRRPIAFSLVLVWILFTVSLVTWWMIFGLKQVERIAMLDSSEAADLIRHQKMLFTEGVTMIVTLILGGLALIYYLYKQIKEAKKVRDFFLTFTHEIKTPLAAATVKLDILEEKLAGTAYSAKLTTVQQEFARLNMQIENSLFLCDEENLKPIFENIDLDLAFKNIFQNKFSDSLKFNITGNAVVKADRRMFETIISNIFRNSIQHGKSSLITISIETNSDHCTISIHDNGEGFKGDKNKLSNLFHRFYPGSGSGIGLYLAKKLTTVMNGKIYFIDSDSGFLVHLKLKIA